jgi:ATP-binding cassette subfamily C protein
MNTVRSGLPELRNAARSGIRLVWAVFLFSIFVNLLMLTGPLFMVQVYDRVLTSRSEETLVALFLLVSVLFGLMAVLDWARGRVLARFGARFQSVLEDRIFDAVLDHAISPTKRPKPASGLRDLATIRSLFTSPVALAVFDIPWTPVFIAAIFVFHPWLGWMAMFGSATMIVIALLNNRMTSACVSDAQTHELCAQALAEQARRSADYVNAQGVGASIRMRWHACRDVALDLSIRSSDWAGLFMAVGKSYALFLQAAMLALGAYLVLQNELSAGAMIASSVLLRRAVAPVQQALAQWPMVQQAQGAWATLGNLLETSPVRARCHALPRPEANISFAGVSVADPKARTTLLDGITFSLVPGQAIGIIGKSGSGKTTLARTLLGLTRITTGEVRFGGVRLDQYDPDILGSYIGYLPQTVTLFSGTIAENIARLSPNPDAELVVRAAKCANAHEMILSLPDGYNTRLHGDDCRLSGGQRQRIALARAVYGSPVLLLLDEPNSALDHDGSVALNTAIRSFKAANCAVIIMTHRPSAISECDRLMVLESGCIKTEGARDTVLKSMIANVEPIQASLLRVSGS